MDKVTKIILNGSYGGFSIDKNVLNEYNKKTNKNLSYCDPECRFIPEFIEKIENGESINENDSLYIAYIPNDAFNYNAWQIEEYDGTESISVNYEKIKIGKIEEFFNILKKILYDDSIDLSSEMRFEYIRMLAPLESLEDIDYDILLKNAELLPMFSKGFQKAEKNFRSHM